MRRIIITLIIVVCVIISFTNAPADEITTQIEKAKTLYSHGNYSQAISELNFAIGQIQSLQIERYKIAFPKPLPGWEARDFESSAAGMALMGGGTSVSREYTTNHGETSIKIEVVADSPLLSSLTMMISNPMFLGGNKMVSVGGEKAVEDWKESERSGQLQIIIQNRIVITVSGNGIDKKDMLYSYANIIDISKLKSSL